MPFQLESNYNPRGDGAPDVAQRVNSGTDNRCDRVLVVFSLLAIFLLPGCLAMVPKPGGYSERPQGKLLFVSETFQFVHVGGLLKAKSRFTIPQGAYRAIASDANGDYFLAPGGKIPVNIIIPDYYRGGIYRRNSSPPRYFVFSMPITEMDLWTRGQYPQIGVEIPQTFISHIRAESRTTGF